MELGFTQRTEYDGERECPEASDWICIPDTDEQGIEFCVFCHTDMGKAA